MFLLQQSCYVYVKFSSDNQLDYQCYYSSVSQIIHFTDDLKANLQIFWVTTATSNFLMAQYLKIWRWFNPL